MLADIGRLQLDDLGEVLGGGELLGEVEARIEIALGNLDDLAVEGGRALACRVEGTLHRIHRLFKRILGSLVGFARLHHRLLGEGPYAFGHGGIEAEPLKLGSGLTESIARLLGGSLGRICVAHDINLLV